DLDGGVPLVALHAAVAGAAHGDVEAVVGAEGDGAVRVLPTRGQVGDELLELTDVHAPEELGRVHGRGRGQVDAPVVQGDAVDALELDERVHEVGDAVAVLVAEGDHVAL